MKWVMANIVEQVRGRIWEEAGPALELVSCRRITAPVFPPTDPSSVASAFPAVGVRAAGWRRIKDENWQIGAIFGAYRVEVVIALQVDPTAEQGGMGVLDTAAEVVCGLFAPHDLALWWQSIEGWTAESLLIADVSEPEDPQELEPGLNVASLTIGLEVVGMSHPTGPVSYPGRQM